MNFENVIGDIKSGVPVFQVPPFTFEAVAIVIPSDENGVGNSSLIFEGKTTTQAVSFFKIVQDLGTGLIMVPVIAILEQVAIAKAQGIYMGKHYYFHVDHLLFERS